MIITKHAKCMFRDNCLDSAKTSWQNLHIAILLEEKMFLGRENELDALESLWRKSVPSLVTCRGRRRIGKSTLIEEFARRSRARIIVVTGEAPTPKTTNETQLRAFSKQLAEQTSWEGGKIADWYDAFKFLDQELDDAKTVVLLDEVSWMGGKDPDFPGQLKTAWDRRFKRHRRLILVVCGSVSTWIEENILNNTGFVGRSSLNLDLRELPLRHCARFWGEKAGRIATREIIDVLSVTGGVPRYLEDIDTGRSAVENIRRLCFLPKAPLRDDFSKIFNSVFGDAAETKKTILEILADGPLTLSALAEKLGVERGGYLGHHLSQLKIAGFIAEDEGINPETGRPLRISRYRLRDNYTRFFLKCIRPHGTIIDSGAFSFAALESLPGWNSILGLQFENLIVSNLPELLPLLGMNGVMLSSAAPYRQMPAARRQGCQIDLLLQAGRTVCVVEIKRRNLIGREIEDEVAAKIKALNLKNRMTVRAALVYDGELAPSVETDGFFDAIVPVRRLLGL